jgi:hypothetical protein
MSPQARKSWDQLAKEFFAQPRDLEECNLMLEYLGQRPCTNLRTARVHLENIFFVEMAEYDLRFLEDN